MTISKPHIFVLLAVLVLGGVIVSPALALGIEITAEPLGGELLPLGSYNNLSYDVSAEGKGIQRISFDLATDTRIDYTLFYGNGSTVSGYMEYNNVGLFNQHSEVSMNGVVSGYDYFGLQEIGRIDIVGYARNWTTDDECTYGFVVYDSVFGISERKAMVYYETDTASDGVIYAFSYTANRLTPVAVYQNSRANVARAAHKTIFDVVNDWIELAQQWTKIVTDFVFMMFGLIKFFFIDNLLLIIALWLSITMAYSAVSSRDIFGFYKKFFGLQRALLNFILFLWQTTIDILAQFRGIFRI